MGMPSMADSGVPAFQRALLAGLAWAGMSRVEEITKRIAWLIASKRARPEEILALTFTEKAAAELRDRFRSALVDAGCLEAARIIARF